MAMVGDWDQVYFSTQDSNFLRHQFCLRNGMTREGFYDWILEQSLRYNNRAIARMIQDSAPAPFAESTVRKWVGHWVRDSKQDLNQVSIWNAL